MNKPFRFGLQSFNADTPDAWRTQARRCEALGFATLSVADHVIGPGPALQATNHPVQNLAAIPAMAVAIEATSTIRVGARVFCVDYRQPVVFAKEVATLDFFADGRLELGLGAGWLEGEYDAIGVPFDRAGIRLDRLEETIALLRSHFGEGLVDLSGRHINATGFEGVPKPPHGHPPLMIGGGAQRVLTIAGAEADIVSLNFDNRSGRIGPAGINTSTADRTLQKIGWIKAGAGGRFDDIELEIGAYFTVITNDRETTIEQMSKMLSLEPAELAEHPHALIGSVDHVCDQLIERRERFGISYVTFSADAMEAVAPIVERLTGA